MHKFPLPKKSVRKYINHILLTLFTYSVLLTLYVHSLVLDFEMLFRPSKKISVFRYLVPYSFLFNLQANPTPLKHKYGLYSPTSLHNAYEFVKEHKVSVHKAAKMYGVPEQTLRDRIKGKINLECVTTGREPVLSMLEEAQIVQHLKIMAQFGYGYTKQETVGIATDFAIQLCKRTKEQPLTLTWFEGFRNRWPEIKVQKPRSLEHVRVKWSMRPMSNSILYL